MWEGLLGKASGAEVQVEVGGEVEVEVVTMKADEGELHFTYRHF